MINFRFANEKDNMKEIAKLIYDTDPYIYPCWFGYSEREGIERLSKLLISSKPSYLYHFSHFYLALDGDRVVGLVDYISSEATNEYYEDEMKGLDNYTLVYDKYLQPSVDEMSGVKDKLQVHCFCVDSNYRRHGIGFQLLNNFLREGEKMGYKKFFLCCLRDNVPANNLYKKAGFKKQLETVGFGTEKLEVVPVVEYLLEK